MLQPQVLQWARVRAGYTSEELARKVGAGAERVVEWERSGKISMAQAERLAHHTHTPLGYLYLSEPPDDRLPIPDFRTMKDQPLQRPSPGLLETVQAMQIRQAWMREELITDGMDALDFVGKFSNEDRDGEIVRAIREALNLENDWAVKQTSWENALRFLRDCIEKARILVVINGVVGNNTHRKLDPGEFRGFALVDEYAPLIFVNGADYRSAQMFTLVHELAHIFVGANGVSNFDKFQPPSESTERLCNLVAAEFLVPSDELRNIWGHVAEDDQTYLAIARHFKVSTLVAARRAFDLGLIDRKEFFDFYNGYRDGE